MKKVFLAVLAGVLAVFVNGCGKQLTPFEQRVAAKMEFVEVKKEVVKAFNYRTNANGLLEFELILQSPKEVVLEYKVQWRDAEGFILKAPTDGEFIRVKLRKNNEFLLARVATNKAASDFTLTLRKQN